MKKFSELRKKKLPGEQVSSFKVDRIPVAVNKDKGKFIVYVDGDRLDSYRTQKEAEKAATTFVKQFKAQ